MTRFRLWLFGLVMAVQAASAAPPNIVVMLVDDMGVMDTSVPFLTDTAGRPVKHPLNEFYRTPAMERLAARGVRFNNFCAMSVCSPSRISLMTGQNAARHRTTNWINPDKDNAGPSGPPEWNWRGLAKKDVTLARLLQQAGYRTIHVGKGHFGPRGSEGEDPRQLGFDVNVGGASIGQPGSYFGSRNYGATGPKATHAVPGLEPYQGTGIFLTEALTLEAKAHLSAAVKEGKPFFLHFAQYAVHSPFESDPRFAAHYADSGKPPAAQAFATLIEGMDKSLSDLLDHLDALGIAGDTLIIFLGDNGSDAPLGGPHEIACAAPLRGRKGSHYEGGMRTPFIAAWAGARPENPHQQRLPIPAGIIQNQLAAIHDLFPTLLKVAGVEAPAGHIVDGEPLDTLLRGREDPSRRATFLMHYPHAPHRSNHFTAFRDGPWKVVYHYLPKGSHQAGHYQLFHLGEDPSESRDLAASKPEELRRHMASMVASLESLGALYPQSPEGPGPLKPRLP
ncbi:MAG: sulfatase [Verrucomicrobiales bacterium]